VAFLVLVFMFVCIVGMSKFLSLGSIMCVMMYPLILNRIYILLRDPNGVPFIPTLVSFAVMVIVVAKHKDNIQRLMKGQESKFAFKKSVKPSASAEAEGTAQSGTEDDKKKKGR